MTYAHNAPRHRAARCNPPAILAGGKLFGVSLQDMGCAAGGFLVPPTLEGILVPYMPTMLQTGIGRYAVKAGVVLGLSYAGSKFINPEAGKMIGIGGIIYIMANAVIDFMPSLFAGFSGPRGYMNPGKQYRMLPARAGMGSQPFLGKYGKYGSNANPANDLVVERMNPDARF